MYGSNTTHSLGERRRVFLLVKKLLLLVKETPTPLVNFSYFFFTQTQPADFS